MFSKPLAFLLLLFFLPLSALAETSYYLEGSLGIAKRSAENAHIDIGADTKLLFKSNSKTSLSAGLELGVKNVLISGLGFGLSLDYLNSDITLSDISGILKNKKLTQEQIQAFKNAQNVKDNNYVILGNIYYQFPILFPVKPYLGLGLGATTQETDLAFAFSAGLEYPLNDTLSIGIKYKYLTTGSISTDFANLIFNSAFPERIKPEFSPKAQTLRATLTIHF